MVTSFEASDDSCPSQSPLFAPYTRSRTSACSAATRRSAPRARPPPARHWGGRREPPEWVDSPQWIVWQIASSSASALAHRSAGLSRTGTDAAPFSPHLTIGVGPVSSPPEPHRQAPLCLTDPSTSPSALLHVQAFLRETSSTKNSTRPAPTIRRSVILASCLVAPTFSAASSSTKFSRGAPAFPIRVRNASTSRSSSAPILGGARSNLSSTAPWTDLTTLTSLPDQKSR